MSTLSDDDITTTTPTMTVPGGDADQSDGGGDADQGDSGETQVDPAGIDPAGADPGGGGGDADQGDSGGVDPS